MSKKINCGKIFEELIGKNIEKPWALSASDIKNLKKSFFGNKKFKLSNVSLYDFRCGLKSGVLLDTLGRLWFIGDNSSVTAEKEFEYLTFKEFNKIFDISRGILVFRNLTVPKTIRLLDGEVKFLNDFIDIVKDKYNALDKIEKSYPIIFKTNVKTLFNPATIKLHENRIVIGDMGIIKVEYFDGDGEFEYTEFSNLQVSEETDEKRGPYINLCANKKYGDGSGGISPILQFVKPSEKKKLEKVIFYFKKMRKGFDVKDLDKLYSESEKKEKNLIENTIRKFDKDNNGALDIIEDKNEFNQLLKKHQKLLIEKGKEFNQNYTHQFIKVNNYLKQKRTNLQLIFDCVKQVKEKRDLNEYVGILENEIHSYNLLLINSLNLIVSLIEDDQITFYEIYERFDKLNIYNSNWENEISLKLTSINKEISELKLNIKELMYEIRDMGGKIVNAIDDLSYITKESTKNIDNRLSEIDSSIKTNNLITLIQTYQTFKINKNTKSLRG
jgi:hypothetical protein